MTTQATPSAQIPSVSPNCTWHVVAMLWGPSKGLYDANTLAAVFAMIRPEARGTAAGFMNTIGWLGGGGTAPLVIGIIASHHGLGPAIALASVVYVAAGLLLLTAIVFFVKGDAEKMQRQMQSSS